MFYYIYHHSHLIRRTIKHHATNQYHTNNLRELTVASFLRRVQSHQNTDAFDHVRDSLEHVLERRQCNQGQSATLVWNRDAVRCQSE